MSKPKRLIVLSRSRTIGSTKRLLQAARARGYHARALDPADCSMQVSGKTSRLLYRGRRVPFADVVIPRVAPSGAPYTLAVIHHFELSGSLVLNGSESTSRSRNKMRSLQLLAHNGIRVPKTVMGSDAKSIKALVPKVGGMPVLVRVLQGGDRKAVMVCETMHSLDAALEVLLGLGQNLLVQQYVRGAEGRDVRALVVGERVVCAVRRTPRPGQLASTLERGARYEPIEIEAPLANAAVKAAVLMGLDVAAVDMLDEGSGPKVFEVHGSPPLVALERATGLDLAGTIVDHVGSPLSRELYRVVGI